MSLCKTYYYSMLLCLCPFFSITMERKPPIRIIFLTPYNTTPHAPQVTTHTYPSLTELLSPYNTQQRLLAKTLVEERTAAECVYLEQQILIQRQKIALLEKQLEHVNKDIDNTRSAINKAKEAGK